MLRTSVLKELKVFVLIFFEGTRSSVSVLISNICMLSNRLYCYIKAFIPKSLPFNYPMLIKSFWYVR